MIRPALIAAALVAGCAAPPPQPSGPFIVLHPAAPAPASHTTKVSPDSVASAAVLRDTAALQDQAVHYVARRDAKPAVIDQLSTLALQSRRAIERLQADRRAGRYVSRDVTTARVAADALAAFLATQAAGK